MDAGLPDRGRSGNCSRVYPRASACRAYQWKATLRRRRLLFADKVTRNRGEMFQRFGLLFLIVIPG